MRRSYANGALQKWYRHIPTKFNRKKPHLETKYVYFGIAQVRRPTIASFWFFKMGNRFDMVNVEELESQ